MKTRGATEGKGGDRTVGKCKFCQVLIRYSQLCQLAKRQNLIRARPQRASTKLSPGYITTHAARAFATRKVRFGVHPHMMAGCGATLQLRSQSTSFRGSSGRLAGRRWRQRPPSSSVLAFHSLSTADEVVQLRKSVQCRVQAVP